MRWLNNQPRGEEGVGWQQTWGRHAAQRRQRAGPMTRQSTSMGGTTMATGGTRRRRAARRRGTTAARGSRATECTMITTRGSRATSGTTTATSGPDDSTINWWRRRTGRYDGTMVGIRWRRFGSDDGVAMMGGASRRMRQYGISQ